MADDTTVNLVYDKVNKSQADGIHAELDRIFSNIPKDRPRLQHFPDLESLPNPLADRRVVFGAFYNSRAHKNAHGFRAG
jgi:hypothetical protein